MKVEEIRDKLENIAADLGDNVTKRREWVNNHRAIDVPLARIDNAFQHVCDAVRELDGVEVDI